MSIARIARILMHPPVPLMYPDETGSTLDGLLESGKVKAVGVSNFRPWDFSLLQSSTESTLVTNQIEISLTAVDAFTNGDLAYLQERMIPPMAWSPLGGGALFSAHNRSEEHTSELQSLMRISYAVFRLKKKHR